MLTKFTFHSFRGTVSATGTGASSLYTHTRGLLFTGKSGQRNYLPSPWKSGLFLSKLCAPQLRTREKDPNRFKTEMRKGKRSERRLLAPSMSLSPPAHSSCNPAGFEFKQKTLQTTLQLDLQIPQCKAIHRNLCTTTLPSPADEMETRLKGPE